MPCETDPQLQALATAALKPAVSPHRPTERRLQKLHSLLQQLDRSRREDIIRCEFTQEQRLALERWILQRSPVASAQRAPQVQASRPWRLCSTRSSGGKCWGTPELQLKASGGETLRGVTTHRRAGRTLHSAVVHVERLELRTREVQDMVTAIEFRAALLAVKDEISAELSRRRMCGSEEDEELAAQLLARKVSATLADRGLDADRDLGLYFRATTPARQWIGTTLCGPVFHLRSLEAGLQGWQQMQRARGVLTPGNEQDLDHTWAQARQAHLDLLETAGRRRADAERRLDMLEHRGVAKRKALLQRWSFRERRRVALEAARKERLQASAARKRQRVEACIRRLLSILGAQSPPHRPRSERRQEESSQAKQKRV
eukprot:TRINITY_DN35010_c0_g1_i1.p1 TRINITY_DN35010_c0_g1~~TRINITY_DN35010_c0_g1_i1.p1  ORF type:complete len:374 (+),score=93.55 TRINITY_DN35010_c0_g1_i1:243-1364(+)